MGVYPDATYVHPAQQRMPHLPVSGTGPLSGLLVLSPKVLGSFDCEGGGSWFPCCCTVAIVTSKPVS